MNGIGMLMNIIIAGGGTGGHLFPGVAIAEEFLRRDGSHQILFVGTDRGLEKKILGNLGFSLRTIDVEGVKGRGLVRKLKALLKIPRSLLQAAQIIRRFQPAIVIGVGGYASGPAVLAAYLRGIKTAIAEQNAIPGLTNRILGRFAARIFVSFAETSKWFAGQKTIVTGNPIRANFTSALIETEHKRDDFRVLVFGGSQGAHAINEAVLGSLEYLRPLRDKLRFTHQTGADDRDAVARGYERFNMDAKVETFIMEMAAAYRSADLLICRAGATSIAEITAMGKAAILIPFPYAINDHQTKNAEVLVREGAAQMIPQQALSGKHLAEVISELYIHREALKKMERSSARLGNARAAADVVDACLALVK
jgi:UDP-N-acetylglucosamine--N-acetylmuramyl-(pentapeptide) pyrophosphoryl-undecaprenol N-acetylglucosamine transferase